MYISANISKILTLSRTVDDLNKKRLAKIMANPFKIGAEGQNRTADTGIFSLFEWFLRLFPLLSNLIFVFILSMCY